MTFWIVAMGLAAVVAGLIALALLRARQAEAEMERFDIHIYRDQLNSVDKDLVRGIVTDDEADRLRTEIKRRILEADRATGRDAAVGRAPRGLTIATAVFISFFIVVGSLLIYGGTAPHLDALNRERSFVLSVGEGELPISVREEGFRLSATSFRGLGAPGYPDLPRADRIADAEVARRSRPGQAQAEQSVPPLPPANAAPEFVRLMEQLRAAVAERPDDLQGHVLLARNEASLGNFIAAHEAQAQVLRIRGAEATASDFADYGDLLVLAAGGYVSPEAERAFETALQLDPTNGAARYYLGAMYLQTGRPDLAFNIWEAQLRAGPADAPWIAPIRGQIETAAVRAGVDYQVPAAIGAAPSGPSSADMSAAADMSPLERMEMIEGMVAGLSERLATEGGPPEEWARLIRAYGVLGRRDAAAAIWAEAQQVFADDINRVPILQAARDAGVAQ